MCSFFSQIKNTYSYYFEWFNYFLSILADSKLSIYIRYYLKLHGPLFIRIILKPWCPHLTKLILNCCTTRIIAHNGNTVYISHIDIIILFIQGIIRQPYDKIFEIHIRATAGWKWSILQFISTSHSFLHLHKFVSPLVFRMHWLQMP